MTGFVVLFIASCSLLFLCVHFLVLLLEINSVSLHYPWTVISCQINIYCLMFPGQSAWLEETCTPPCQAAVVCVSMASSTCLVVIMQEETQTGWEWCHEFLDMCLLSLLRLCWKDFFFLSPILCGYRFIACPWEHAASCGRKWQIWKDFLHPPRTS